MDSEVLPKPTTSAAYNSGYVSTEKKALTFTRLYSQTQLEVLFQKSKRKQFVIVDIEKNPSHQWVVYFSHQDKKKPKLPYIWGDLYAVEFILISQKVCPGLYKSIQEFQKLYRKNKI